MPNATRYPSRVAIREVGMRDGLQSIKTIVCTEKKLEWLAGAHAVGEHTDEIFPLAKASAD